MPRLRPGRFSRRLAGALLIVTLASCNFGSEGQVGSSGTTSGVFLQTSRNYLVGFRNMTNYYEDGAAFALSGSYAPTALDVAYVRNASSCTHDVCMYDTNDGDNGFNGWNACSSGNSGSHPNMTCSRQHVTVNEHYLPPNVRIACHELAHSTGLRHTDENASCVKRTAEGGTSDTLSGHDKDHLNARYG